MRLAIIGTGKIVKEALYALQGTEGITLSAIWARPHSRQKAENFARQYGIPEIYTDYEELLAKTEADTVYIGLVNSVHYEYAKAALLRGKHVILEKPFTWRLCEAEELRNIASERGLFLFEAITVLHSAAFDTMKMELPKLGAVKMVLANYSQYSSRYDDYLLGKVAPAFDPACCGGALGDINVYNVHYAAGLFGHPERVQYYPNVGFSGADISGTLVLSYPGFSAVCTGAKDSDSPCFVSVQGERGWMKAEGKPNAPAGITVECRGAGDAVLDISGAMVRPAVRSSFPSPDVYHRMTRELQDFSSIIARNDRETADALLNETLTVVDILEQARISAGLDY